MYRLFLLGLNFYFMGIEFLFHGYYEAGPGTHVRTNRPASQRQAPEHMFLITGTLFLGFLIVRKF